MARMNWDRVRGENRLSRYHDYSAAMDEAERREALLASRAVPRKKEATERKVVIQRAKVRRQPGGQGVAVAQDEVSYLGVAVAKILGIKLVTSQIISWSRGWEPLGDSHLTCTECPLDLWVFRHAPTGSLAIVCPGCRAAWRPEEYDEATQKAFHDLHLG